MKRALVLGSLAAALLVTGCSQKSETASDANANKPAVVSAPSTSKDSFTGIDKNALAKKLESQIQSVYFDFDKFNVKESEKGKVDGNAKVLSTADAKQFTVRVEGNCDEWGSDEYNYALGLKRATTVQEALVKQGVAKDKTVLISYGESKPVCQEHNKDCWAKNRRVDHKLLP